MFDRSDEAYTIAKGLATSINFPNALVFDAYLMMVRSRPENWREDFTLLRDRFSKVIEEVRRSGDADMLKQLHRRQSSLAQSLVAAVPLYELGKQLATLNFMPPMPPQAVSDDWLIDSLLQPSGPLCLQCYEDIDEFVISDRTNKERKAKVEITSQFVVGCIFRGLIDYKDHQSPTFSGNATLSKKSLDRLRNTSGAKRQNWPSQSITQEAAYGY